MGNSAVRPLGRRRGAPQNLRTASSRCVELGAIRKPAHPFPENNQNLAYGVQTGFNAPTSGNHELTAPGVCKPHFQPFFTPKRRVCCVFRLRCVPLVPSSVQENSFSGALGKVCWIGGEQVPPLSKCVELGGILMRTLPKVCQFGENRLLSVERCVKLGRKSIPWVRHVATAERGPARRFSYGDLPKVCRIGGLSRVGSSRCVELVRRASDDHIFVVRGR